MTRRSRFILQAPLRRRDAPADAQSRAPTPEDLQPLAQLMLDAYAGTVDDDGESIAEARVTMDKWRDGEFGPPLWDQSEVTQRAGRIVSATLLTLWQERPFVAFMFTAPQHQGRGLARAALLRVMNRLAERGDSVLRLVVTQGNASAERLYERLGFSPEAQPPLTTA